MKTEAITLSIFVLLILSVIKDIYSRIIFQRDIHYNALILLKHKDFRKYSIGNSLMGIFAILLELLKFKSQSDAMNYLGLFCIVIVNVNAAFKLSNFTAIGDTGIWYDGKKIKWERVEAIGKNERGFIVTFKNTDHIINFQLFEKEEESKKLFADGIRRYSKMEYTKIKI